MTAGSAAHALLAFTPAEEVTRLLPAASFTARTLLDVRRRGWAHSVAEREPGVASLSAPVRDGAGARAGRRLHLRARSSGWAAGPAPRSSAPCSTPPAAICRAAR